MQRFRVHLDVCCFDLHEAEAMARRVAGLELRSAEESSRCARSRRPSRALVSPLLMAIAPAMAQNPQADYAACDQYARQAAEPYRNQANLQGVGSALVGAGLGAALGGAIGGGRGAGIGAASGALAGTGVGAASSSAASGQVQEIYNSYFYSCMQSRQAAYGAPAYGASGLCAAGIRRAGLRCTRIPAAVFDLLRISAITTRAAAGLERGGDMRQHGEGKSTEPVSRRSRACRLRPTARNRSSTTGCSCWCCSTRRSGASRARPPQRWSRLCGVPGWWPACPGRT